MLVLFISLVLCFIVSFVANIVLWIRNGVILCSIENAQKANTEVRNKFTGLQNVLSNTQDNFERLVTEYEKHKIATEKLINNTYVFIPYSEETKRDLNSIKGIFKDIEHEVYSINNKFFGKGWIVKTSIAKQFNYMLDEKEK